MASDHGRARSAQSGADSTCLSNTLIEEATSLGAPSKPPPHERLGALLKHRKPRHNILETFPPLLSRFLGYRPPSSTVPHETLPTPPFTLLRYLSLRNETYISATLGSFISILLIAAIMSTSTSFREVYHSPIIVTSFGASAVLVFGVIEAPLAQPRNVMIGQLVSAALAVSITKLWVLGNPDYINHLSNTEYYTPGLINGALCMSIALLGQMVLGSVHPPGGATALAAATDPVVVALSWHYIPIVLVSSAVMVGWALVINNLGRRRYPIYWWSPGEVLMEAAEKEVKELEEEEPSGNVCYGRDVEALGESVSGDR